MTILRSLEKLYVLIVLVFLSGAGVAGTIGAGGTPPPPQPWEVIGRLIVCATLAPLLILHYRRVLEGLRHSGWLIALCSFALASAMWSNDPRFVLRHAIFLSVVTLFGIYIATCFEWGEQLDLFGWMSILVVAGSALVAAFIPSYGLSHDLHFGVVKGLYPQKNNLGAMMAFAILTFVFAKPRGIPSWLRFSTLMGACVLLVLSSSATAIVALVLCLAAYPLPRLFRVSKARAFLLLASVTPLFAIGLALAAVNFDVIAKAAGRNSTLSDRIPMWATVMDAIGRKPWFGYGFDVFWTEWSGDLVKVKYVMHGWRPPHAHNGYLDVVLSVGIVGLLVFIGGFVTNLWRAGGMLKNDEIHGARWPFFVLLFFAIVNMGESYILRLMSFFWIPYVAIYVSAALLAIEERREVSVELSNERTGADGGESLNGVLPGYST
jgi:exopolysaccharide production protein ExoQ